MLCRCLLEEIFVKNRFWKNKILTVLFGGGLLLCLAAGCFAVRHEVTTSGKLKETVVVIDPGHGGIDPGKVGVGGSYEKDINLSIAKDLKVLLEKEKIKAVMTRETDKGLYSEGDTRKKTSDMRARMELMNRPEVDLIVSVHQNSFSNPSSKGAQVFYQASSESGKELASILQEALVSELDTENHRQAKANNSYYILKKSIKTAVIVECGFLSNAGEEAMLLTREYQKKVADAICKGIIKYLKEEKKEVRENGDKNTEGES